MQPFTGVHCCEWSVHFKYILYKKKKKGATWCAESLHQLCVGLCFHPEPILDFHLNYWHFSTAEHGNDNLYQGQDILLDMQSMYICKVLLFDLIKWGQELCVDSATNPRQWVFIYIFLKKKSTTRAGSHVPVHSPAVLFWQPIHLNGLQIAPKHTNALHLKNMLHQIARYCDTKRSGAGKHVSGPVKNVLTPFAICYGNVFWTQCRKFIFPLKQWKVICFIHNFIKF